MRTLAARLTTLLGLALLVATLGGSGEPASIAAVLSLAAVAALAVAVVVVLAQRPLTGAVGGRARQHRQLLIGMPAPQHPATPGRTRSRAPGEVLPAA